VGVVLDLMIHDLDLALSLINDELVSVKALGAAVIGPNEDWAQARLTFAGGCVANFFASRVTWRAERSLEVITADSAVSIDFATRQSKLLRVSDRVQAGELDVNELDAAARTHVKDHLFDEYLPLTDLPVNKDANPLVEEQRSFLAAIRGQAPVAVTGSDGRRALDVAERILTSIAAHHWDGITTGPIGPRFQPRESILSGPHWRNKVPATRRLAG
jgi:predicted dehydrogenase